jgi:DnaK suppressor protein
VVIAYDGLEDLMFVSFLQRLGFFAFSTATESLKSHPNRDDPNPGAGKKVRQQVADKAQKSAKERQNVQITLAPVLKAEGHPQANAQRRQDVKAPAKKSKTPVKVAAKSAAKPVAKTLIKKATKPVAKSASVAIAKKIAPPPKIKLVAVPKAPPVDASSAKKVNPKKTVTKAVDKLVSKPAVKPAAKTVLKSLSSSSAKVASPIAAKAASLPTKPVPAPKPAAPPVPKTMITPPPALKPGRRSSARTAAMSPPPAPMVPTHAPDAAKASYSTITERVISPPPHVAARKDPKLANNWKTKEASELTDEEVKAMPDSEYMNDKQLAFFRHKLSILKS